MEVPAFSPAGLDSENLEKEKDWAQKIEQVKDFLEKEVDFSVIADIIGDILKKCYPEISDETVKARLEEIYRPRYDVFYEDPIYEDETPDTKNFVLAQSGEGRIHFFARQFFKGKELDKVQLLHVAIHEALHLASTTFVNLNKGSLVTGVLEVKDNKLGKNLYQARYFDALNEGVTEIIADCMYSEYLTRTGHLLNDDYRRFDNNRENWPIDTFAIYKDQRWEVLNLIGYIQHSTDIPVETIIRSIVAEYFKGEGLHREEMLEIYKDYPDLKEFMERHKRNMSAGYDEEAHRYLTEELPSRERSFVHALFGRDEIGAYNSRIRENK